MLAFRQAGEENLRLREASMGEVLRNSKIMTLALAVGLGGAACGGGKRSSEKLPPSINAQRFMTADECKQAFWHDRPGERQPLVKVDGQEEVVVDGRCNSPLDSPKVALYNGPAQEGQPEYVAMNGDSLLLRCYTLGQVIHDVRGQSSTSDVWLEVGLPEQKVGYIPEVNVGYVDESKLKHC
ncbi:MAG: hypothetical protein JWO96_415 [Candidatus Saccharibacteria bacterium]|nr:hypothetical protein [Candidatus Saccharibacteria bacterium]